MDANSTGLRGLLDVVKSNRLMSTGVIGFLLLMAVMAVIDDGISMMPLILATCAVGTAAVFFWQAGSYRVDIYENGLEIFGGVLTRAGVYLYKDIESIDIEDTTYRLFGVFPVLKYTTVSIQGKNDLWTQLSSFNFTDLKFMRIKVSGELGTAVMSLAVIGLYYGAASFLVENVILRNLTEEERDEHILSKLLFWSTVILLVADVLLVILPAFGMQLLPVTILDFM